MLNKVAKRIQHCFSQRKETLNQHDSTSSTRWLNSHKGLNSIILNGLTSEMLNPFARGDLMEVLFFTHEWLSFCHHMSPFTSVMSRLSHHIIFHVVSWHVMSCHFISFHFMAYNVIFHAFHLTSCSVQILSNPFTSHEIYKRSKSALAVCAHPPNPFFKEKRWNLCP